MNTERETTAVSKPPPSSALSLRARFALGMGAILLPFLVATAVGQFYLLPRLTEPVEKIMEEVHEEILPVVALRAPLLMTATPVHDYLVYGDPALRARFATLRADAERAFARVRAAPYGSDEERTPAASAYAEWQEAARLGEALLRRPDPVGSAAARRDMQRFEARIDRTLSLLEQLHGVIHRETEEHRATARAARQETVWLAAGALALAFGISVVAMLLLARPLLAGTAALSKAAARLAVGDLSARAALDRLDELGQLAHAFNAMAEKIEQHEAALREMATHDGLTGLYNHRTFYTLLEEERSRSDRFRRPLSLLMLDIDHFKRVNDEHGHRAGDAVLRGLSGLLDKQARAIDRVCRYGGEEIAVILPETDVDGAVRIAERLRTVVEQEPFDVGGGKRLGITVSIGVAAYPAQADTPDKLVAAADAALYVAKQAGRNRAVRYEVSMKAAGETDA